MSTLWESSIALLGKLLLSLLLQSNEYIMGDFYALLGKLLLDVLLQKNEYIMEEFYKLLGHLQNIHVIESAVIWNMHIL